MFSISMGQSERCALGRKKPADMSKALEGTFGEWLTEKNPLDPVGFLNCPNKRYRRVIDAVGHLPAPSGLHLWLRVLLVPYDWRVGIQSIY